MPPIPFEFSPAAQADMDELDLDVFEELLQVAEAGLSRAPNSADPDEGRVGQGNLLWRRGITKERRQQLRDTEARARAAAEATGEDADARDETEKGSGRHGWQYFIVYRPMTAREARRTNKPNGVMITHIYSEDAVAGRYIALGGLEDDADPLLR